MYKELNLKKQANLKYKILIIIPKYSFSDKKDYFYTFPLGLAYILAVLKKNGYDTDCLNLNHHDGTIHEIITNHLNKKNYDFVGTGNNALGYLITKIIIESVHEHTSKPKMILGGPIITTNPELIFKNLNPDFGVIGEGEETIIELLDSLEKNKNLEKIKGIVYKDGEGIIKVTEKRALIEDLNKIPFPAFEDMGFEEQLDNMCSNLFYPYNAFDYPRLYPLLGSRSCPFQCTFCYHEGKYRTRTMDNIMEELDLMVKKYKINMISIYDDCFAIDKKRLEEFCKRITKLRKEISWELKWSPQLTVRDVTPETLKMMKDAGCDTISYGFESFSLDILKSMRKPITPEQIDYAFKETLKAGIAIQANFIFGDIAETTETAKITLDYWKNNAKGQIWLDFIQPYPGSVIYKYCLDKGIIKDEIEFFKNLSLSSSNFLKMSDKITDKEFKQLIGEVNYATSKYYQFTKPNYIKEMDRKNYYEVEVKCPFCNEVIKYKNCFITNKFSYSFNMVCRNCHMRFFITSGLRKLAFRYNSKIKFLRNFQVNMTNRFKRIKLIFSN
ncbi:MAG: radical SAM protein [Nanoarchaeota archaeon]|nr:radical SAM protein [Nanoarchaeota archaeon]